jgi:GT2 family glycosyltransferase
MRTPAARPEPAPPPPRRDGPLLSIVIKALNEAEHIQATLESALLAARGLDAEVVLADSLSTDETVALASAYPVRVAQLARAEERCCGIGPQLGFAHARGAFIYLMDGDMRLCPGFLEQALSFLQRHTEVAGVGGRVVELNTRSLEYRARNERLAAHQRPGAVDRLDGGGLYRRRAIESVGYFSNRNLHSYEELELALRLRRAGWTLWRLAADAVTHEGHDTPPYALLRKRWRSGYICGLGELLRASLAGQRLPPLLRLKELRLYGGVLLGWLALLVVALWPLPLPAKALLLCALALAPALAMAWRKRSWQRGLYALVSWNLHAAGLLRGLLRPQRAPTDPVDSRVLHDACRPLAAPSAAAHDGQAVPPARSPAPKPTLQSLPA